MLPVLYSEKEWKFRTRKWIVQRAEQHKTKLITVEKNLNENGIRKMDNRGWLQVITLILCSYEKSYKGINYVIWLREYIEEIRMEWKERSTAWEFVIERRSCSCSCSDADDLLWLRSLETILGIRSPSLSVSLLFSNLSFWFWLWSFYLMIWGLSLAMNYLCTALWSFKRSRGG